MQLNPVYLYPNKVDVFTNLGTWTTERYRKVYQRNFKVFRGVDNRLDLQVRNSDEKMKDITGYTLVFNLIERETQKLILQRDCTTVSAANGKVYVTITEVDLNNIQSGSYSFTIHSVHEVTGVKAPLYCDSQFGAIGTLEVLGDMFGSVKESQVIDTFSVIPSYWPNDGKGHSEIQYASPEVHSVGSVHTFAFYDTEYKGTLTIQGCMEEGSTPSTWVDITTLTFPLTQRFENVVGKWKWFRIVLVPTIAKFDVNNDPGNVYRLRLTKPGAGYAVGDQFVVPGYKVGGILSVNDLTITVNSVDATGAILNYSFTGVAAYISGNQARSILLGTLDKVIYR